MQPVLKNFLKLFISIALLAYLLTFLDYESISRLSGEAIAILVGGVLATFVLLFLMSMRWRLLLAIKTNTNLPLKIAYRGYVGCLFFSLFLPGAIGGDMFRIKYAADKTGIGLKKAGIIIVIERLFGLIALSFFFSLGLIIVGVEAVNRLFPSNGVMIIIAAIALCGLTVFIVFLKQKYGLSVIDIIKSIALSITSQAIDISIAGFVLSVIAPEANPFWVLLALPLAFVATVIPISIGGLGVREGVMTGVLGLFGIKISTAVFFSFLIFLIKFVSGLIGAAYIFWISPDRSIEFTKLSKN